MVKELKTKCKYRFSLPEDDQECIGHECDHYQHVLGKDPQTGEEGDYYMCSDLLANKLKMENTKVTTEVGAAIEDFRNEMINSNNHLFSQLNHHNKLIPKG